MLKIFVVLLCVFSVIIGVSSNNSRLIEFKQNDYKLEFQRVELDRINKQLVSQYDLHSFKYNRTCAVINVTNMYTVDVGHDLEIISQGYKFMSNEYRYFPIRFQVNFCSAVKQNFFGMGRFLHCGNFSGCPLKKNIRYHYCNFSPDPSYFPPLIPDGEYMLEMQWTYHSVELFVLRGYAKIFRPIPIP